MKKRPATIQEDVPVVNEETGRDLDEFIRKKEIQNKILKELLGKLKEHPISEKSKTKKD